MKKGFFALGVAAAATGALFAASDRIDIYNLDGKFVSIMVDNIEEITVGKNTAGEGYSTVNALTPSGMRTKEISEISDIKYVPVNYNVPLQIDTVQSEHAYLSLLDCLNNPDPFTGLGIIDPTKPTNWHGACPDEIPHFLVFTDKGFASEFYVKGNYTGTDYTENPNFIFWSLKENNLLGIDCYAFDMPFEPITMGVNTYELQTYLGAPFLGTYKGVNLSFNGKRLTQFDENVLDAEFKFNGTYVMKTTDSNHFDFLDLFNWNEDTNTFAYVPYEGEMRNEIDMDVKTGAKGTFYGDIVFTWFNSLLEDKPENTVPYIAAREDMTFTMAVGGQYDNHRLVEAKAADGSCQYFYIDDAWRTNKVTMEYDFGPHYLNANCEAYCVLNGEKIFKYTCLGNGSDPTFQFRGNEYGSYSGNGDALFLDGYGKCTFGDLSGRYSIEDGLVNAEFGAEIRIFVVDRAAHTYTEMVSDPWNGQPVYTCADAIGAYNRGEENRSNTIQVEFDKNYAGNDAAGYARVTIDIKRNDGFSRPIGVSGSGKYIYSAETKTVIITNLYIGTSATTAGDGNLTFKVSDDMLSMWLDDTNSDRVFSTSCDGSYVMAGPVNTLTAPAPAAPVELAAKYTGKPKMEAFGNTAETDAVLTIDTANTTATLNVKGMGTDLFNETVSYELADNTLTLKDLSTYIAGAVQGKTDLVFTINEDGTLTSDMIVNANINMAINVDFASAPLTPAE